MTLPELLVDEVVYADGLWFALGVEYAREG
jgi:hypothetical protein